MGFRPSYKAARPGPGYSNQSASCVHHAAACALRWQLEGGDPRVVVPTVPPDGCHHRPARRLPPPPPRPPSGWLTLPRTVTSAVSSCAVDLPAGTAAPTPSGGRTSIDAAELLGARAAAWLCWRLERWRASLSSMSVPSAAGFSAFGTMSSRRCRRRAGADRNRSERADGHVLARRVGERVARASI
jgi:hypothetical protein